MCPVPMGTDIRYAGNILMNRTVRKKGGVMMSFLNLKNSKKNSIKSSLRVNCESVICYFSDKKFLGLKRMSSYLLSEKGGSVTVEAAIAIPVFLFAIINLMSIILMFGEYSTCLADMHQRAKKLSVHAHVVQWGEEGNNDLIIQSKLLKLEPLFSVMGFSSAHTIINCRVRKWTGYDVTHNSEEETEEEWVYITPYGESYHMSRDCRYLSLKIHAGKTEEIGSYRNKSGEIYRQCESCGSDGSSGLCFYTEYGNRYHVSLYCSGLKRTIRTVKKSEVGSRHACSGCCH